MKRIVLMATLFFASASFAGELTVTCGEKAYDAIEKGNLNLAEFAMVVKTRGPNNPIELAVLRDNFEDILDGQEVTRDNQGGYTIVLGNPASPNGKYEITNLQNCNNLDRATADIAYSPYTGGFAGWGSPVRAKCSCKE